MYLADPRSGPELCPDCAFRDVWDRTRPFAALLRERGGEKWPAAWPLSAQDHLRM